MEQIKVYIGSKVEHAHKLAAIHHDGIHVNARWIDMAAVGQKRQKPVTHWQQENFDDIVAAHFFVLYVEPGDKLKGAIGEAFYAVAFGKKVWIAGDGHGVDVEVPGVTEPLRMPHRDILPWAMYRPSFRIVASLDDAFKAIKRHVQHDRVLNKDGDLIPLVDVDILSPKG